MNRLYAAVILLFVSIGSSHAALLDRGNGLIYDTVLDITWLQDANYAQTSGYDADGLMSRPDAIAWADGLDYAGFDDWRLPTTAPINGSSWDYSYSTIGETDLGYNISAPGTIYAGNTGSEMAYMFYNNLGNIGLFDTDGNNHPPGWGLQNTGDFLNLQSAFYWSGTEYNGSNTNGLSWLFEFNYGLQVESGYFTYYAWAVRDGDVSTVPTPAAVWLFGTGLIGLIGVGRCKRK